MSKLIIKNDQLNDFLVDGVLQIPEEYNGVEFNSCEFQEVPNLREGLEEVSFKSCENLTSVTSVPFTVRDFEVSDCHHLEKILLPHNSNSVRNFRVIRCWNLKQLVLPESNIENMELMGCDKLKDFKIPDKTEKFKAVNCHEFKEFRNTSANLKDISFSNCRNLEKVTGLRNTLKKVSFTECNSVKLSLFPQLKSLKESGCTVFYPEHLHPSTKTIETYEFLESMILEYHKSYPSTYSFDKNGGIVELLGRFLVEKVTARSDKKDFENQAEDVAESAMPTLELMQKHLHLLPVVDEIAQGFVRGGCVNQPVRGIIKKMGGFFLHFLPHFLRRKTTFTLLLIVIPR